MKKWILRLWQAWNEAKLGYVNRYTKYRIGS